jgi:hypothetical protein
MPLTVKREARENYRVNAYHKKYWHVCAEASELDTQMLEYESRKRLYERLIYQLQKQVEHLDNMAQECRLKRDELFDDIYDKRIEFLRAQTTYLNAKKNVVIDNSKKVK